MRAGARSGILERTSTRLTRRPSRFSATRCGQPVRRRPKAIGRTIRLDGHPYTVVGVMPASFEVAEQTEWAQMILPLAFTPEQLRDGGNNYSGSVVCATA